MSHEMFFGIEVEVNKAHKMDGGRVSVDSRNIIKKSLKLYFVEALRAAFAFSSERAYVRYAFRNRLANSLAANSPTAPYRKSKERGMKIRHKNTRHKR